MKYVRPFSTVAISPGGSGPWLLNEDEEFGCSIRVARGGDSDVEPTVTSTERYALVLEGEVKLVSDKQASIAKVGELVFVPAGVSASISGARSAYWFEIEAAIERLTGSDERRQAIVIPVDQSRFEGSGFAYQSLIDRSAGAEALKMNVLQVQPGSGSPDYHIHAFSQIYLILAGEMTIDVGRRRTVARANSIVVLPEGVVHRNFNASASVERHVSILIPEPAEGEVFDFAVDIHEVEAELLATIPT